MTADSQGSNEWGDDDPSVFEMEMVGGLEGEFQVTNGYGPEKAPLVMRVSGKVRLSCTKLSINF